MASAVLLWLPLLVVLGAAATASSSSPATGRRLICWQALFQCQGDAECAYAYGLYTDACRSVLHPGDPTASARSRRCPSHCISALIQLNHTRQGPALEDCDCARDQSCRDTKRAIEPCLPRSSGGGGTGGGGSHPPSARVLGCSEARRRCERDPRCSAALALYLAHCGKLFNGMRCTHECRQVIQDMLQLPKALLLSECVCDGLDRAICEVVKENMDRLCFRQDPSSSGGYPPDLGADEDDYDDDEDETEQPRTQHPPRRAAEAVDDFGRGASFGREPGSGSTTLAALPTALFLLLTLLLAWTLAASVSL